MKNPTNLEKELTFGQDDLYLPLFIYLNRNFGSKIFCIIFISCSKLIDLMIKHILGFKNRYPRQNSFDLKKGESVHMNDIKSRCLCEDDCTFAQCSNSLYIRLRFLPKCYHLIVCEMPSSYLRHLHRIGGKKKKDRMKKRPTPLLKDWGWTCMIELSPHLHLVKWKLEHFTL